jgi:hypothetical protein
VSRFEPIPLPAAISGAKRDRFSPVYAGHAIKPLMKPSRFRRGRLQSWTGFEAIGTPKTPAPPSPKATGFPSFRAIHADDLKGTISYRIGFWESEHGRASNSQHARTGLFNESFPACQALN